MRTDLIWNFSVGFDSSLTLTANMYSGNSIHRKVYTIAEDHSKQDDHLNPYSL